MQTLTSTDKSLLNERIPQQERRNVYSTETISGEFVFLTRICLTKLTGYCRFPRQSNFIPGLASGWDRTGLSEPSHLHCRLRCRLRYPKPRSTGASINGPTVAANALLLLGPKLAGRHRNGKVNIIGCRSAPKRIDTRT
jgi:hypothetical protein